MKANSRRFFSSVEALGEKTVTKWAVLALYISIVVFLAVHHEPWYDEYHVWNMVYNMSFGELIDAMRVEGHFCLWHLCVLPWVKLFGMDYHALYMASIPLMSIAAWLLLFKVDFSFWGKLFIIFSAPFIYHFPVIARCYALIPPIVVAIVAVYQRKSSPYLYCLLIGLLAHTHAYMEGLVAILWILFFYRYVIQLWKSEKARAKRNLAASGITVLLVFLAFIQIVGGIMDAINGVGVALNVVDDDCSWISKFFSSHRLRIFGTLRNHFGKIIPNLDLTITVSLYCAIIVFVCNFFKKCNVKERKDYLLIVFIGVLWQILFAINIYAMFHQRFYSVCLPVLMILGMGYSKNRAKYAASIALLFWMINTPCQYVIIKEVGGNTYGDVRCAADMERIIPGDKVIYVIGDVSCIELMKREFTHIEVRENDSIVTFESICNLSTCAFGDYFITDKIIKYNEYLMESYPAIIYRGFDSHGSFSLYRITRHETGN